MSEIIRPQFTYSPEGELTFRFGLCEGFEDADFDTEPILKNKQEVLDQLGKAQGIQAELMGDDATVSVNVEKRFHKSIKDADDHDIDNFLRTMNLLLPFAPEDSIDRVLALEHLSYAGAHGIVNQHFQRWLNVDGIPEETARDSIVAMALPFGKDDVRRAKKSFRYRAGEYSQFAEGELSRISVKNEEFGLYKTERTDQSYVETEGEVDWPTLVMSTLGNCACWGSNYEDRLSIRLRDAEKQLYKFSPHNIDVARQSLSLVLGMGILAHETSKYEGREDIFADAKWKEPRTFDMRS